MSESVNIVRCKNCQWYGNNWVSRLGSLCMHTKMRAHYEHLWVDPDFFCAHGETYIEAPNHATFPSAVSVYEK